MSVNSEPAGRERGLQLCSKTGTAMVLLLMAQAASAQDSAAPAASTDVSTVAQSGEAQADEAAAPAAEPAPEVIAIPQADTAQPLPAKGEAAGDKSRFQRIDEITVTAQKRVERVQDVPVSMSVINEEQLRNQNISTVDQLARAAPSVEFNGIPGNPQSSTSIRGISTFSFSPTAEQAVSYVIDGVVEGKAPSVSLFDVSRVEVLRGPQGTLFGKNASAGVISITTTEPDPGKFEVLGRVDAASVYSKLLMQGAVNVPVSESSAFRFSVGRIGETGLLENRAQTTDSETRIEGARLRYLWDVTPGVTLNLIGEYEDIYLSDQSYILYQRYDNKRSGEPVAMPGCGGAIASYDARVACNKDPTAIQTTTTGVTAMLEWNLDDYILTSISSARRYQETSTIDPDGLPQFYVTNGNTYDNRTYSQELRIATPSDERLSAVAGLYYSRARVPNVYFQKNGIDLLLSLTGFYNIPLSPCSQLKLCLGELVSQDTHSEFDVALDSYAAFGNLTYHFTDDWRLLGGVRYTRDSIGMAGDSVSIYRSSVTGGDVIPARPAGSPSRVEKVNDLSWRLGTQYDFSKDAVGYLTASRGYKAGQLLWNGPNDLPINGGPSPASITTIDPEYPMDYEAGIKTTLFEGLFAFNANLFHNTISGFQTFNYTINGAVPVNVSQVVTQGIEVDMLGMVYPGLFLNGGLIYNHATYPKDYMTLCTQKSAQCPNTLSLENIGGRQVAGAPRFKASLTTGYGRNVNQYFDAFFTADAVFKTDIHYNPSNNSNDHSGDRTIVGFRAGISAPDRKWGVSIYGRNIFGAYNPVFLYAPYLLGQVTAPDIDSVGYSVTDESYALFGMSLEFRF